MTMAMVMAAMHYALSAPIPRVRGEVGGLDAFLTPSVRAAAVGGTATHVGPPDTGWAGPGQNYRSRCGAVRRRTSHPETNNTTTFHPRDRPAYMKRWNSPGWLAHRGSSVCHSPKKFFLSGFSRTPLPNPAWLIENAASRGVENAPDVHPPTHSPPVPAFPLVIPDLVASPRGTWALVPRAQVPRWPHDEESNPERPRGCYQAIVPSVGGGGLAQIEPRF